MMRKPVLVGIDGSPESLAAARWAGREASRREMPVHLVNVWQNPVSNIQFSPGPEGPRLWQESQVRSAGKILADHHPNLAVSAGQVTGTATKVLLEAAQESEMIVLGSRGIGGITGFFLGSVGLHLLARTRGPVVFVRAVEEGNTTDAEEEVVLGIDLGQPCDSLIAFAFEEAHARGSMLRAVHVWDENKLYGYAAPGLDARLANELRAEQGHQLSLVLAPWRAKFPEVGVEERIAEGPVTQRLTREGRGKGLLVVGRRRRSTPSGIRIGPVTHGVLHHAASPVAVVSHD